MTKLEQLQNQVLHAEADLQRAKRKQQIADEELAKYEADIADKKRKALASFNRQKDIYEVEISTYPPILEDLVMQRDAVETSLQNAIKDVGDKQKELDNVTREVDVATDKLDDITRGIEKKAKELIELNEVIDKRQNTFDDLSTKILNASAELDEANSQIEAAKQQLYDLRADVETRKLAIEDEMKITLQKSSDVVQRLIALESREQGLLKDMESRIASLNSREEVVRKREMRMDEVEKKASQYARFMKL